MCVGFDDRYAVRMAARWRHANRACVALFVPPFVCASLAGAQEVVDVRAAAPGVVAVVVESPWLAVVLVVLMRPPVVVGAKVGVVATLFAAEVVGASSPAEEHATIRADKPTNSRRIVGHAISWPVLRPTTSFIFVNQATKNDPRTIFGWAMYDWTRPTHTSATRFPSHG